VAALHSKHIDVRSVTIDLARLQHQQIPGGAIRACDVLSLFVGSCHSIVDECEP
jgi:hypothetical protein